MSWLCYVKYGVYFLRWLRGILVGFIVVGYLRFRFNFLLESVLFFFDIWNVFIVFGFLFIVGIKRKNFKMICLVFIMVLRLYKIKDNLISFFWWYKCVIIYVIN